MESVKEKLVFACGYCGKLYYEREQAELCHGDKTCRTCGKVIGKKDYYLDCPECRAENDRIKELEIYNKARKMTEEEYFKEFPNHMLYWNDRFMYDSSELEYDYDKENYPKYVYGTRKTYTSLDADSIISQFEEDTELEDYEMDKKAKDDIIEFCKQWNEKYRQQVFFEDNSVVVLVENEEE